MNAEEQARIMAAITKQQMVEVGINPERADIFIEKASKMGVTKWKDFDDLAEKVFTREELMLLNIPVKVPFCDVPLGLVFRHERDGQIWVKIGPNLVVSPWDISKGLPWAGQKVCCFSDKDDLAKEVWL